MCEIPGFKDKKKSRTFSTIKTKIHGFFQDARTVGHPNYAVVLHHFLSFHEYNSVRILGLLALKDVNPGL